MYYSSRLNGGEFVGNNSIESVIVSTDSDGNVSNNNSKKMPSLSSRECDGTKDNDSNKLCSKEVSNNIGLRFRLRTYSMVLFGWLIKLGRCLILRCTCCWDVYCWPCRLGDGGGKVTVVAMGLLLYVK